MSTFLLMCFEFFKTGLLAIGGGLATIPFLEEMANKYGWFTLNDLSTMIAVSESTPGPIGVNMATYIGNKMFGFVGGIGATISLVMPSVIVICIIAKVLTKFKDSKVIKGIFNGLRPATIGLIFSSVLGIYLSTLLNIDIYKETNSLINLFGIKEIILFALLLALYKWKDKMHPIFIILIAGVCGVVFGF